MINEAECKETLEKLNSLLKSEAVSSADVGETAEMVWAKDGKWAPYSAAVKNMEKYMETEEVFLRDAAVKFLDAVMEPENPLNNASVDDELVKAISVWTLGEVSKSMDDGGKYARFARDLAYETVLSKCEKSADTQAVLASAILSLELNRHLPRFMRQVYDQHARILVDDARKSEKLSDMGIWFLRDALEKLLITRRNYRW